MVDIYQHERECPKSYSFTNKPFYKDDKTGKGYLVPMGDQYYDPQLVHGDHCMFCGALIE